MTDISILAHFKFELCLSTATLVKDIFPGSNGSIPENLTNVNGTLFFTANDGINGKELWKSDGTEEGTTLVKDIRLGISSSNPSNLINLDGALFFTADDGINGTELWTLPPNEKPTAIILSSNTIAENSAAGKVLGTLSTIDPDAGDTHTYTLNTIGSPFEVVRNNLQLKTGVTLDFELPPPTI
ncbi:MAG: hypothetical protein QNJ54_34905 [Prochloraceae cyanobacterium]|nr:hypothetical protein [Prochloraceae cyanobacterium]